MNNDLAVAYILVINSKEQSSLTNYEESQDNEEYSNQGFHYISLNVLKHITIIYQITCFS